MAVRAHIKVILKKRQKPAMLEIITVKKVFELYKKQQLREPQRSTTSERRPSSVP
jgi:hypothetical protein